MKKILIAAALSLLAVSASAQSPSPYPPGCYPDRSMIVPQLRDQYSETGKKMGLSEDQRILIELWTNEDTGSFTILLTDLQTGLSCVRAAGFGWTDHMELGDPA